jgi:hypothetical protein
MHPHDAEIAQLKRAVEENPEDGESCRGSLTRGGIPGE